MNSKFKQIFGVLAIFMAFTLTGCGGGDNSGASAEISPAGAVSTEAGSVDLGAAGNYALLGQAAVGTTPDSSNVNGNVGVYPAARGYLTGWSQTAAADASDVYSTSAQVAAPFKLYAADYAEPTPTNLLAAVSDMGAAYDDAAIRDFTDASYNNIDATTLHLAPLSAGVYRWDNALHITTPVTFDGTATDVWIIQVGGTLNMDAGLSIILSGEALPQNIFWQVAGAMTVGAGSHFEGVVLGGTDITFLTGSTINGRLMAKTAIALDTTTVAVP